MQFEISYLFTDESLHHIFIGSQISHITGSCKTFLINNVFLKNLSFVLYLITYESE